MSDFSFIEDFWLDSLSQHQQLCVNDGSTTTNDVEGAWGVLKANLAYINSGILPLERLSSFTVSFKLKVYAGTSSYKTVIGLIGETPETAAENTSIGFVIDHLEKVLYTTSGISRTQEQIDNTAYPDTPVYRIVTSSTYPGKTVLAVPNKFLTLKIVMSSGTLSFYIDSKLLGTADFATVRNAIQANLWVGFRTIGATHSESMCDIDQISFSGSL